MTKEEIELFISNHPYGKFGTLVYLTNKSVHVGFFPIFEDSLDLQKQNKWRFVSIDVLSDYRETKMPLDKSIILNGEDILELTVVTLPKYFQLK